MVNGKVVKGEEYHYVDEYTGIPFIDSIIAMYLVALGEFDMDGYKQGPNKIAAWIFFILASYLLLVVFMNMLIAIMGETFSQVQSHQVESGLQEQLNMIDDFSWLIDLKDLFKNSKYIIIAKPDTTKMVVEELHDVIHELGTSLTKKNDLMFQTMFKLMDNMEKNIRVMSKGQ